MNRGFILVEGKEVEIFYSIRTRPYLLKQLGIPEKEKQDEQQQKDVADSLVGGLRLQGR